MSIGADSEIEELDPGCPGDAMLEHTDDRRVVLLLDNRDAQVSEQKALKEWAVRRLEEKRQREQASVRRNERIRALAQVHRDHPWIVDLPVDQAVPAQRTMLHVDRTIRFVELMIPRRVAAEEIGDAIELMAEHFKRSPRRWPVYVKLVTMVFWIIINTVRYVVASFKGSKAEGSKNIASFKGSKAEGSKNMYVNDDTIIHAAEYYISTIFDYRLRSQLCAELRNAQLNVRGAHGRFAIEVILPSLPDDVGPQLRFSDATVFLVNEPGSYDLSAGPVVFNRPLRSIRARSSSPSPG